MARITFEFDPDFDENVYHASRKSGSSLRGLYDKVRTVTDEIRDAAKLHLQSEATQAEADANSKRNQRFKPGSSFLEAKARSFALRSGLNTIRATMEVDSQIYGKVSINRQGSTSLEYGGIDVKAEIGKGTGKYVVHPAYAFLRTAMRKVGG